MSKILAVCLGGTISSVTENKVIRLKSAPEKTFWDKFKISEELVTVTPVLYSSENADIDIFKDALRGTVKAIEENKPDGVLILHGTDSMVYFAQLAVRVMSYLKLPVVITGAMAPLDDPHSDGIRNVKYALGLLSAAIAGKSGNATFGIVFSDSFIGQSIFVQARQATGPDYYGEFKKHGGKGDITELKQADAERFLEGKTPSILTIPCVPGFPVDSIDPSSYDAVLIMAYHSGTADTKALPAFLEKASSAGVPCFLGSAPKKSNRYSSQDLLSKAGVTVYTDIPFEGAWAETVIKTSL